MILVGLSLSATIINGATGDVVGQCQMQFGPGKSIPIFVYSFGTFRWSLIIMIYLFGTFRWSLIMIYLFGTLRWSLIMNSCRNLVLGSLSTDS